MNRTLYILGTASQVPTRTRNHIGCFLRWDKEGILFDPGEGTQRQLIYAGIRASEITKICLTHFHGDHCLGLPGVIQRISLDRTEHPVEIFYPSSGEGYLQSLLNAAIYHRAVSIIPQPILSPGIVYSDQQIMIESYPLDHGVDTLGYRLKEFDQQTILPELLPDQVRGYDIGQLKRHGRIMVDQQTIYLDEVSTLKTGQGFAFVLDTRICDNAYKLAKGVDLMVCEATYLTTEQELAYKYRHLTAAQAAEIASAAHAKQLVLLHFSQRYASTEGFYKEASSIHPNVIVAQDGLVVDMPVHKRPVP
ncbi:MAG TPA: ribonuclease Z [Desulfohalobiaceae bacterium]|nr:ribonuclease Z [Desulfohalobiaceae bacterium]